MALLFSWRGKETSAGHLVAIMARSCTAGAVTCMAYNLLWAAPFVLQSGRCPHGDQVLQIPGWFAASVL